MQLFNTLTIDKFDYIKINLFWGGKTIASKHQKQRQNGKLAENVAPHIIHKRQNSLIYKELLQIKNETNNQI